MRSPSLHRLGLARPFVRAGVNPRQMILSIANLGGICLATTRVPHGYEAATSATAKLNGTHGYDSNSVQIDFQSETTFTFGTFSVAGTGGVFTVIGG